MKKEKEEEKKGTTSVKCQIIFYKRNKCLDGRNDIKRNGITFKRND